MKINKILPVQRIRSAASNKVTRANEPNITNYVLMEYHILLKMTLDSRITDLSNDCTVPTRESRVTH